ncbi:MAG: hypothetical protein HY791_18070 [Deltaproteobacteria bacterium]|nr:hypothetical protein [Deltaproteobacteria bacterium]
MTGPIRIQDQNLFKTYAAQLGKPKLGLGDAQQLVNTAKADGKIDATEAADLSRIARASKGRMDKAGLDLLDRSTRPAPQPFSFVGLTTPSLNLQTLTAPISVHDQSCRPSLRVSQPTMPADNTRVAPRAPKVETPPVRPQHQLRQGRALTEYDKEVIRYQDNQRRLQQSRNAICNGDPVAAQINGNWQDPVSKDWTQVGPDPLSTASQIAFGYTVPGQIVNAGLAIKSVKQAVSDPTTENIVESGLKVGLTVGGHWAKIHHSPIKHPITVTKGLWNAQKSVPHGDE